jgi:hypothetical protein
MTEYHPTLTPEAPSPSTRPLRVDGVAPRLTAVAMAAAFFPAFAGHSARHEECVRELVDGRSYPSLRQTNLIEVNFDP